MQSCKASFIRHKQSDPELSAILDLILESFAYMADRIDPPSSIYQNTVADLAAQCVSGEVWSIAAPPVACVCLTPRAHALGVGRLAVAPTHRGKGLGRRLIEHSERRAVELGYTLVELMVRVELEENLRLYKHMGYHVSQEAIHPGFDRPTYLVMQKQVGSAAPR